MPVEKNACLIDYIVPEMEWERIGGPPYRINFPGKLNKKLTSAIPLRSELIFCWLSAGTKGNLSNLFVEDLLRINEFVRKIGTI